MEFIDLPLVHASAQNVTDFGLFVGTDVPNAGLTIPFYKGSVEEGHNIPFECYGRAVIRTRVAVIPGSDGPLASAAAAVCSTRAAFCCVAPSS